MDRNTKSTSTYFAIVVFGATFILAMLKLVGLSDITWISVFIPMWIPLAISIVVIYIIALVQFFQGISR